LEEPNNTSVGRTTQHELLDSLGSVYT
jgi:hypothetical protein